MNALSGAFFVQGLLVLALEGIRTDITIPLLGPKAFFWNSANAIGQQVENGICDCYQPEGDVGDGAKMSHLPCRSSRDCGCTVHWYQRHNSARGPRSRAEGLLPRNFGQFIVSVLEQRRPTPLFVARSRACNLMRAFQTRGISQNPVVFQMLVST